MKFKRLFPFFVALIIILSMFTACDSSNYKKAVKLMDSGNYEEAKAIFTEISDYKDSAEMILECQYQTAQQFFNGGKYDNAVEIFQGLDDYKDSADMVIECRYSIAQEYLNSKKFTEANEIFIDLGDYKDSADMVIECRYLIAQEYLNSKKITEAIEIFKDLEDYKDSKNLIKECYWKIIFEYYNNTSRNYSDGVTLEISTTSTGDGLDITCYTETYSSGITSKSKLSYRIEKDNIKYLNVNAETTSNTSITTVKIYGTTIVDLSRYKLVDSLDWDTNVNISYFDTQELKNSISEAFNVMFSASYLYFEISLKESELGITLKDLGIG